MRTIFAELTLAALLAACSEQATAPLKKVTTARSEFTTTLDGSAPVADAVLCSNASGSVFVRQQCQANEHQLDPVALGLVGVSGHQIVAHQELLSAGTSANVHVECPTGKKVLGGGFDVETPNDVRIFSSQPSDGNGNLIDHGWNAFVQNAGSSTRQATVIAICALVR